MLNLPTNTGLSDSSAGCIPPFSYQGDKNALHPIGETTLPYFLYMEATYPSPVSDNQSGYIVLELHSIPASKTSSLIHPSPCRFSSYKNTNLGNNTGFLFPSLPCPFAWTSRNVMDAIFPNSSVARPNVIVMNG